MEDTEVSPKFIAAQFGQEILKIITANTKNSKIEDADQRKVELVERCLAAGEEAIIVKAADVLDNFKYFEKMERSSGVEYASRIAYLLLAGLKNIPKIGLKLIKTPLLVALKQYLKKYPQK